MSTLAHSRCSRPTPTGVMQGAVLQRKCGCGAETFGGAQCGRCAKKNMQLQRQSVGAAAARSDLPASVRDILRAPGQPLDRGTREFMEPRLGGDFSQVRVHTDSMAARSAQDIDAYAYTVGRDVVFGPDKFAPATTAGKRLLAHELTHVLQQASQTGLPAGLAFGAEGGRFERDADDAGERVVRTVAPPLAIPRAPDGLANSRHLQRAAIHDGNILFEGGCAFLACLRFSCEDEENGVPCAGQKTKKNGDGKKYRPLFTCDKECNNDRTCDDNDDWMAIPRSRFAYGKCGQSLVVCANGANTSGSVRDKSEREAWEVSPGIQSRLGVSGKFKGVIYPDTNDPAFKKDKRCHPKASSADTTDGGEPGDTQLFADGGEPGDTELFASLPTSAQMD